MMRPISRPWTAEDDERIRALAGQGASIFRAAAALKRATGSVRTRARLLGCTFPPLRSASNKAAVQRDIGIGNKRNGQI
jgi:hypothetical protein